MSKRRFLQLHLSTAVMLMLVAGVLVWANVREEKYGVTLLLSDGQCGTVPAGMEDLNWAEPTIIATRRVRGCPFIYSSTTETTFGTIDQGEPQRKNAIYDTLIALAILLAVWQVCEWRIRRNGATGSKSSER